MPSLPDVRPALAALLAARADVDRSAACRVVLRLVVILLAEARALLPRTLGPKLREPCTWLDLRALFTDLHTAHGSDLFAPDAHDWPDTTITATLAALADIDFTALTPEHLGVVHEQLLAATVRKGAGSFYTHPQLARPTAERTLAPLLEPPGAALSLAIVDPAMGAGNFLLAAHRVLTDHILTATDQPAITVRRAVALRCLHGVDCDPLAVELARLALWLEVADPSLPFTFFAPNLRRGDALVGAWQTRDVPPRKQRTAPPRPLAATREAHDEWCARWFNDDLRFFHWQLEFPEVFARGGFDAVLGNPPWDIRKPSSHEFFSAVDPTYRARSKQDALRHQQRLFTEDPALAQRWHAHHTTIKKFGEFTRHTFAHQGSADLSNYKLFVEQAYHLLRPGGQLGLIVPGALYTDKGSAALRRLLLTRCRWRWLYGFENRRRLFEIHRNFKFAVVIAEKGGETDRLQAAFMRHDAADWTDARGALVYPAAQLQTLSPRSRTILEIRSEHDLAVLTKIHTGNPRLGDAGPHAWNFKYSTEWHTTNDSALFVPRDSSHTLDEYGCTGPHDDILLPLYEGRMIGAFDPSKKGWLAGKGRTAVWRDIPWPDKRPQPQFMMRRDAAWARNAKTHRGPKAAYMRIASATNSRTVISTYLRDSPASDSVFFFLPPAGDVAAALALVGIFNSFVYDFAVRARAGGLNLSEFLMLETPLVARAAFERAGLTQLLLRLACASPWFAPEWLALGRRGEPCGISGLDERERLRLRCMLDAVLASLFDLDITDLRWILRDCDLPRARLADHAFTRTLDPKGFWRVDRARDPELRHAVLTLVAFAALTRHIDARGDRHAGITAFLNDAGGVGWQLPDALRLADHDLGHDARARTAQPVAERLGPMTTPPDLEDSWTACERHARACAQLCAT